MNGLRSTVGKLTDLHPATITNDFGSLTDALTATCSASSLPYSNRDLSVPLPTYRAAGGELSQGDSGFPSHDSRLAMAELAEQLVSLITRLLSVGLREGVELWSVLETLRLIPGKLSTAGVTSSPCAANASMGGGAGASAGGSFATQTLRKGTVVLPVGKPVLPMGSSPAAAAAAVTSAVKPCGSGVTTSTAAVVVAVGVPVRGVLKTPSPGRVADAFSGSGGSEAAVDLLQKRVGFAPQLIRTVEDGYAKCPSPVRTRVFLRLALNCGCLCSALELIARHNRGDIAALYANPELNLLFHYKQPSSLLPSTTSMTATSRGDLWEQFQAAAAPVGGVPLCDIEAGATKGFSYLRFNLSLWVNGLDDDLVDYVHPTSLTSYLLSWDEAEATVNQASRCPEQPIAVRTREDSLASSPPPSPPQPPDPSLASLGSRSPSFGVADPEATLRKGAPTDAPAVPVVKCFYHYLAEYICGLTHTPPSAARCVRNHHLAEAWRSRHRTGPHKQVMVQVLPVNPSAVTQPHHSRINRKSPSADGNVDVAPTSHSAVQETRRRGKRRVQSRGHQNISQEAGDRTDVAAAAGRGTPVSCERSTSRTPSLCDNSDNTESKSASSHGRRNKARQHTGQRRHRKAEGRPSASEAIAAFDEVKGQWANAVVEQLRSGLGDGGPALAASNVPPISNDPDAEACGSRAHDATPSKATSDPHPSTVAAELSRGQKRTPPPLLAQLAQRRGRGEAVPPQGSPPPPSSQLQLQRQQEVLNETKAPPLVRTLKAMRRASGLYDPSSTPDVESGVSLPRPVAHDEAPSELPTATLDTMVEPPPSQDGDPHKTPDAGWGLSDPPGHAVREASASGDGQPVASPTLADMCETSQVLCATAAPAAAECASALDPSVSAADTDPNVRKEQVGSLDADLPQKIDALLNELASLLCAYEEGAEGGALT